ncbi:MAG: hypothetical protein U0175_14175 [Caldilineaceae bacterium]
MFSQPFIFWLFDWDDNQIYDVRFYPLFIRCEITSKELRLESSDKTLMSVPLESIISAKRHRFVQSLRAGASTNLKLTLTDNYSVSEQWFAGNELYLSPMHVFSEIPQRSYHEIDDLVTLIQDLKTGQATNIHPNPYYREFQRQNRLSEFSEEKWRASTSPSIYTKFVTGKGTILTVISAVAVFFVLFILIAAAIFNVIMPWFQGR